jgi:hypothetical protein
MLLLWPAIYNGQPLFSNDTTAYIRGFDAGVVWLSGRTSAWTTWASQLPAQAAGQEYSAAGDYSLAPNRGHDRRRNDELSELLVHRSRALGFLWGTALPG